MDIEYTNPRAGITAQNRTILERIHRSVSGPFTAQAIARTLALDLHRARKLLAYFASRGWLARVRRGLYTAVPLGAEAPSRWREDPWVVATTSFAPCFITGWSAAEHWALTEQIFRDVVITTGATVRQRAVTMQGTTFRVHALDATKHFGTRTVWRGRTKVSVADPARTIIDMLDDPARGGGIRHVADVLANYFSGEHRDEDHLVNYATRLGNRTVFKRLGYLAEYLKLGTPKLIDACFREKSSGITQLDPSVKRPGRILKRWNLSINVSVESPKEPA